MAVNFTRKDLGQRVEANQKMLKTSDFRQDDIYFKDELVPLPENKTKYIPAATMTLAALKTGIHDHVPPPMDSHKMRNPDAATA